MNLSDLIVQARGTNINEPPGAIQPWVFGTGNWRLLTASSGVFVVPAGIISIRVRGSASGGGAGVGGSLRGGCGAGYAHGVFAVTPGQSIAYGCGLGVSTGTNGGPSTFGALLSCTGGDSGLTAGAGGTGTGGQFQAAGGTSSVLGGGGAAGSQMGVGGNGASIGGGAVGGVASVGVGGASMFGPGNRSSVPGPDLNGALPPSLTVNSKTLRFPFDGFTGMGGYPNTTTPSLANGGPGAGGSRPSAASVGGNGGIGAGGGSSDPSASAPGGDGGFGAGSGWGASSGSLSGPGFWVVEW